MTATQPVTGYQNVIGGERADAVEMSIYSVVGYTEIRHVMIKLGE